jgi:Bacterial antitoxin of ParD toxin-antitoxin type II system and RHH
MMEIPIREREAAEQPDVRIAALSAALISGENNGLPAPFDFDAFIARKQQEVGFCRSRALR